MRLHLSRCVAFPAVLTALMALAVGQEETAVRQRRNLSLFRLGRRAAPNADKRYIPSWVASKYQQAHRPATSLRSDPAMAPAKPDLWVAQASGKAHEGKALTMKELLHIFMNSPFDRITFERDLPRPPRIGKDIDETEEWNGEEKKKRRRRSVGDDALETLGQDKTSAKDHKAELLGDMMYMNQYFRNIMPKMGHDNIRALPIPRFGRELTSSEKAELGSSIEKRAMHLFRLGKRSSGSSEDLENLLTEGSEMRNLARYSMRQGKRADSEPKSAEARRAMPMFRLGRAMSMFRLGKRESDGSNLKRAMSLFRLGKRSVGEQVSKSDPSVDKAM